MSRAIAKLALEQKDVIKEKFLFNRDLGIDTCIELTKDYPLNNPMKKGKISCLVTLVISPYKLCQIHFCDGDLIYTQNFNNKKFSRFLDKKIK